MPIDFDAPPSPEDVERLFQLILTRPTGNPEYGGYISKSGVTVAEYITRLRRSEEFRRRFMHANNLIERSKNNIDEASYRSPKSLALNQTQVSNVLLIGSCLMDSWVSVLDRHFGSTKFERITVARMTKMPYMEAAEAKKFDFQIIQVPLRAILQEVDFFQLKYQDKIGHENVFSKACSRLWSYLKIYSEYNKLYGMMTFVLNFPTPQQNLNGRLLDRYSFNNPIYFYEELNRKLHQCVAEYTNMYVLDFDQITANFGKKYAMDDAISISNHGAFLGELSVRPGSRLEPPGNVSPEDIMYPKYIRSIIEEAISLKRTVEQTDGIKMVVFDLDDTLWNGVAAELDDVNSNIAEGWPVGVMEALSILWRRGILVAIVSKNDESVVRSIWEKVYGSRFALENFVSIKINWRPKAENIGDIMKEANLLPNSVLFVDDNPVERANVKSAFPEIRTLDVPLVDWRRTLMWAPELQRAAITDEAGARTEMIQAQIKREEDRVSMGEEDFLADLNTSMKQYEIISCDDKRFDRVFELINKTNQFNTTGKRWTINEFSAFFAAGGCLFAVDVSDKYTSYGITAIILVNGNIIDQVVMSCRVFGMRIEHAAIALACNRIAKKGHDIVLGKIIVTEKNRLSRSLFADCGFVSTKNGDWTLALDRPMTLPSTVTIGEVQTARQVVSEA